jgi:hypothetical protein
VRSLSRVVVLLAVVATTCGKSSPTAPTPTPTSTRVIALAGNMALGDVQVGTTATATMTISNSGNANLTVTGITYPSGFSGNWASGTIAAGGSQNVTVTFAPTSATSYSGTLTVNGDQTSGTSTATVSGTGTTAQTSTRVIALTGNLAFGNVQAGTTATATVTISNSGNANLTVTGITYPSGFSGNWASGTIAAGGSQNVTVTFAPTSATSYSGTVTVSGDQTSGSNTIALSGTGTTIPTDTTPPVFVSVSFSPSTVSVSGGAATVTATLHIIDVGTGVNSFRVFLTGPTGVLLNCSMAGTSGLVSGTINDGIWACPITVPAGSAAGVWRFTQVDGWDKAQNSSGVSGAAAAQLSSGITVTNSISDTTPPTFVSVSFSPTTVNVSAGAEAARRAALRVL